MTKRQTWLFFLIGTLVCALAFIGMTIHSHTRFGELTNADKLTPQVVRGMDVWHAKNCINCHTLLGEGAYFAPDLTKITTQRGDAYLTAFMKDPSQFFSPDQHIRVMPDQNLSDEQIADLLAFLTWVSNIDTNGWPPRPILVQGSAIPGANVGGSLPGAASDDPIAIGQQLFHSPETSCYTCHSTSPGVNMVGPSLADILAQAETYIHSDAYTGKATTPEEYIRESILEPNVFLVPGKTYSAGGRSIMPDDYADRLNEEQINDLIRYLMSIR